MADIKETIEINSLLSIYGELLTDLQKEVISAYYAYNLSIGEIAIERNVSRAAVDDALKKGVAKLREYEKTLEINKKHEEILKITAKIKQNTNDQELIKEIEEIERRLNYGI